MSIWKSRSYLLLTASAITIVTYLLKKCASQAIQYLPLNFDCPSILIAIFITFLSAFAYSQYAKFQTLIYNPSKECFQCRRDHLGISIAISSFSFTIRSFYLSFYDFETSLTSLYTAFMFMIISIATIYGKTGVPSFTVVISASHTSLVLSFFGLAIMITPNMMNPAFVMSFTATFSLVISVVLFWMNTTRPYPMVDGLSIDNGTRIMNSAEILEHLENITQSAEEVFSDEDVKEFSYDNLSGEGDQLRDANNQLEIMSDERDARTEIKKLRDRDEDLESITEAIINDLTEQVKSLNTCTNYFISSIKPRSKS